MPPLMPTWEAFMVPVLEVLADGRERSRREMFTATADRAGLTPVQRGETLNTGGLRATNRIGWAMSYLAKAQAVGRPRRGHYVITDLGRTLLAAHPDGLTEKDLQEIPAYRDYVPVKRPGSSATATTAADEDASLDPIEQIDAGMSRLQAQVAADLLTRLRAQDPSFLEQSVLDVLVAMGYGGAQGRAQRIGGTGDSGVDGVIDQDALGLDRIYVQAKRYGADNTVGRETIQAFVGALHGRNAARGIFITTSRFSPGAVDYAATINSRVVLIDGQRLAELMIKYGVGVQTTQTYSVVEIDEDYFE